MIFLFYVEWKTFEVQWRSNIGSLLNIEIFKVYLFYRILFGEWYLVDNPSLSHYFAYNPSAFANGRPRNKIQFLSLLELVFTVEESRQNNTRLYNMLHIHNPALEQNYTLPWGLLLVRIDNTPVKWDYVWKLEI